MVDEFLVGEAVCLLSSEVLCSMFDSVLDSLVMGRRMWIL